MAKGRRDPNWQQKVLAWQASGKNCLAWCKENKIPYTTFLGWRQQLENASEQQLLAHSPKGFIELKEQLASNSVCSGITLEYQGIKIYLQAEFNPIVLKKCIACLGGVSC